ncbi:MAG TPA: glycosyltransferase family 4 protein [Pseudolabrys sp.]|jgi:glycosyltransferase involved in cell wall biosynthesis
MTQKILYLVSEDWYFVSHRLPMARAARRAGYEVHVATHIDKCAVQIEREGFILHQIRWRRGGMNPFRLLGAVMETRSLYLRLRPDLVHHVAVVSTVIGSLAALALPMQKLNAFAGLGFTFASATAKAQTLRALAAIMLGWLLRRPNSTVLVQNPDDCATIEKHGVPRDHIAIIPGSGVDVDALTPLPDPDGPDTIGFAGRLLDVKGVQTLVRAHEILMGRGVAVRLLIAGRPDASNPSSIPEHVLAGWRQQPNLVLLGHIDEIRTLWAQAHIAIQPSLGGEGAPMSLLEAAACGRPLIATDVPGCREIARPGVNALLVPANDPGALADAIENLMKDRTMRSRFGSASRKLAVDEFSSAKIGREIVALYTRLLKRSAA